MMFINPETCIDCEACVAACPVDAIFHEADLPKEWYPYRDLNATMARQSPLPATGFETQIRLNSKGESLWQFN